MVFTGEDRSVFHAYLRSCERSRELMRQHGEVLHQQELNIASLFTRASSARAAGPDWLGSWSVQDLVRSFGRATPTSTGRNANEAWRSSVDVTTDVGTDNDAVDGSANSTLYIPLYEVSIPLNNGHGLSAHAGSPLSRFASAATAISNLRTAFGQIQGQTRTAAQTQRGLTSADISRNCSYVRFGEIEAPLNSECPITQEAFGADDTVLQIRRCRHNYHAESLLQWFRMGVHCPLCREDLRRPAATANTNATPQRAAQTTGNLPIMNEIDIESELAVSLEPILRSNVAAASSASSLGLGGSEALGALLGSLFANPAHLTTDQPEPEPEPVHLDEENEEEGER